GAGKSAVSRWKQQYLSELDGKSPGNVQALTPEQQRIQLLEKKLQRALRDNDILKKATAFFIRDNCQQQPKSDPLHHLNNDPLFIKVFH
ncbi:transposase, partial [Pseudoalteromonas sp. SG43-7]|nr:transposase [Pseudoalteromonas sp. SG43-7]